MGVARAGTPASRRERHRRADVSSTNVHSVDRFHNLTARCRGEFLEMPGMRLTLRQATRLWSADLATCETALDALVASGFLRKAGEAYMRAYPGRGNA